MSDTSPPVAQAAVPPPEHPATRRRFSPYVLIGWIPIHRSAVVLLLSWSMPFVIMGVGYSFGPLRTAIVLPWHAPVETWGGIVVQLIVMIAWLVYEFWYTNHRNTAISQLQADLVGDITTTGAILIMLGGFLEAGTLKWWFIVPLVGALIDLFQSGLQGINNAAEKPSLGPKLGT